MIERHDLGRLEGGFAQAFTAAEAALQTVLVDRAVWAEEAARAEADPIPWPPSPNREGLHGVMRWLFAATVDTIGEARLSVPSCDVYDFQQVLRVAKRAVEAAAPHLDGIVGRKRYGWREFLNWLKARRLGQAIASGLTVEEGARKVGLPRSAAFRIAGQKQKKR